MGIFPALFQSFEHLSVNAAMWFIVGWFAITILGAAFGIFIVTVGIRDYLASRPGKGEE